ncbi:MAG: metal-dependent hydrolase [Acetobacteraceae bacterium]|nr:MAG: metal-dependent hydrolase [Acetobacteraceae bacterium]
MGLQTGGVEGTVVTFAGGSLREDARVIFSAEIAGEWLIITDRSPFHPVSLSWPDQPGDRGWMLCGSERLRVLESREALLHSATGVLSVGDEARALKRADPGLTSVVLHVTEAPPSTTTVTLEVDAPFRAALSRQHTGVHLAALALNNVASGFWTKDPQDPDGLGAPNLDKSAVTRSEIGLEASLDHYRLGKSLRKKGFEAAGFLSDLPARGAAMNAVLREMLATPAVVRITPAEGPLADRRLWTTRLNGTDVKMPCGGTHLADLAELAKVTVSLTATEDGFSMQTSSTLQRS